MIVDERAGFKKCLSNDEIPNQFENNNMQAPGVNWSKSSGWSRLQAANANSAANGFHGLLVPVGTEVSWDADEACGYP